MITSLRRLDLHVDREGISRLEDWLFFVAGHLQRVADRQTRQRIDVEHTESLVYGLGRALLRLAIKLV